MIMSPFRWYSPLFLECDFEFFFDEKGKLLSDLKASWSKLFFFERNAISKNELPGHQVDKQTNLSRGAAQVTNGACLHELRISLINKNQLRVCKSSVSLRPSASHEWQNSNLLSSKQKCLPQNQLLQIWIPSCKFYLKLTWQECTAPSLPDKKLFIYSVIIIA